MATPRSFAKKLRAFAADIPKQQALIKQALAQETVNQVVGDTPVDTGRARDGWITAIGSPDTTSIPRGPYGPSVHRGQRAVGGPTRGGNRSVNTVGKTIKSAGFGIPIFLTNNLPYIARLNDGYSKQAPQNFFQIAINRARGIIKRQAIRYGVKS